MPTILLAPLWADNARLQRAANNNPSIRQHDRDPVAVGLLQQASTTAGFPPSDGVDGDFGPNTARAVIAAETRFGFTPDGTAGREVLVQRREQKVHLSQRVARYSRCTI